LGRGHLTFFRVARFLRVNPAKCRANPREPWRILLARKASLRNQGQHNKVRVLVKAARSVDGSSVSPHTGVKPEIKDRAIRQKQEARFLAELKNHISVPTGRLRTAAKIYEASVA